MNTSDVLKYGHQQFLGYLNQTDEKVCTTPGACGKWSPKDIVVHITSYEHILNEALRALNSGELDTPYINKMIDPEYDFNNLEVDNSNLGYSEALKAYIELAEENLELVKNIPKELLEKNGTISWYGDNYSIEDYIVYAIYGQKREHGAQIDMFTDIHFNRKGIV